MADWEAEGLLEGLDGADRTARVELLDTVMIISVFLAIVLGAVWFFAFAGSSLPT